MNKGSILSFNFLLGVLENAQPNVRLICSLIDLGNRNPISSQLHLLLSLGELVDHFDGNCYIETGNISDMRFSIDSEEVKNPALNVGSSFDS